MRTDEMIKTDVVRQMNWDNRIDASNVSVIVDDGHVTLTGKVPTYTAKRAAVDDTWLVTGVKSVADELTIEYSTALTIPSDAEIRSNVESVLLWDPDLTPYKITVEVASGWVTLEGTVDSLWQKVRAENEAWSTRGVIGVTNKLAVVPTERITDEIIGEDVADAIDRNINVDVDDVTITVDNGEVTLTGTVPTWAAKSSAYRSALYTQGVTDVENELVVEYAYAYA